MHWIMHHNLRITYTHNLLYTHTHTSQHHVGKRWALSADLKGEADWETLISFGSVFQSVGAIREKEHSPIRLSDDKWYVQYMAVDPD